MRALATLQRGGGSTYRLAKRCLDYHVPFKSALLYPRLTCRHLPVVRTQILSACTALVYHPPLPSQQDTLATLLGYVVTILGQRVGRTADGVGGGEDSAGADRELQQLQHGCIDLLGLMCLVAARNKPAPAPSLIVEVVGDTAADKEGLRCADRATANLALETIQGLLLASPSAQATGEVVPLALIYATHPSENNTCEVVSPMHIHVSYQTNRQTDRQTDRQRYPTVHNPVLTICAARAHTRLRRSIGSPTANLCGKRSCIDGATLGSVCIRAGIIRLALARIAICRTHWCIFCDCTLALIWTT